MSSKHFLAAGFLAATILAPMAGVSTPALAADAPPPAAAAPVEKLSAPVIAVVDIQKITQESEASKGIQAAIEARRDVFQKEITGLEDKLRSAEQALRKQQTVLSADALATKRKDFEKQVADVQRTAQNRKRALDQAFGESMGQVQKAALEILAEVARERGANMVIGRHQFIIMDTKLDVTDEVMAKLNARLPKVAVNIPKE